MKVLVACEFSGTVRDAFTKRGHEAWSCDLLPTEKAGRHFQQSAIDILWWGWDLLIAHPPCTYIANSGARWLFEKEGRWKQLDAACAFFRAFLDAPIPRIAVENPRPHKWGMERIGRKFDCLVQPHEFGDKQKKGTCLWLKNLPPLMPTTYYQLPEPGSEEAKEWEKIWRMAPGADQKKNRSRTFQGIADAMAEQWG